MIKNAVEQLYSSTIKLMNLVEEEITLLEMHDGSAIDVKRNVTETLNKLVSLIKQLGRMNKDDENNNEIDEDDQAIIDEFLARNR